MRLHESHPFKSILHSFVVFDWDFLHWESVGIALIFRQNSYWNRWRKPEQLFRCLSTKWVLSTELCRSLLVHSDALTANCITNQGKLQGAVVLWSGLCKPAASAHQAAFAPCELTVLLLLDASAKIRYNQRGKMCAGGLMNQGSLGFKSINPLNFNSSEAF